MFIESTNNFTWQWVVPETPGRYGGPFTTILGPPRTIDSLVADNTKCCPDIRTFRGSGEDAKTKPKVENNNDEEYIYF